MIKATPSTPARLALIVAGRLDQLTGGYLYDRRIVEALRARGITVELHCLDGRFPEPDDIARASLERALASCTEGSLVVLDGLAANAMPEVLEVHRHRLSLVALIHHPLGDEAGLDEAQQQRLLSLECRALEAVRGIIVTSAFTRRRLVALGAEADRISVVEPGIAPVALSPADGEPPRLLCIATLIPRKGQHLLIEALAALGEYPWHCDLIGDERDADYARALRELIEAKGLASRLTLHGALPPQALEAHWQRCDLFVLPSFYEGYGMVVAEALAHGLPVVTTTGGALADTLPPTAGLHVPPGDAPALAEALSTLLWHEGGRSERYARLRAGAVAARDTLNDWPKAADAFRGALERIQGHDFRLTFSG